MVHEAHHENKERDDYSQQEDELSGYDEEHDAKLMIVMMELMLMVIWS
jgi:hypothetical protein